MECTQKLDFDSSQSERICPEQIGFLGIMGTKYPVKHGPNKIGRDPQACGIVLNLNSISRQHAVINILNGSDYMIMDLDSANKTKLNNKPLPAYLPAPLRDGDTVQFGDVFGVFRALEPETCLPATQALPPTQVLESPGVPPRLRACAIVPESPDVSDRDDSFIVPSQPKSSKSPGSRFIKSSSKTLSLSSNKIDNVYWTSAKKSKSFNLDDSGDSLNESRVNSDIHEMETQAPYPRHDESTASIYSAETQPPPAIDTLDTQMPAPDHLPSIHRSTDQQDVEIDLFANKENDKSIYNAETQMLPADKDVPYSKDVTDDNIFNAATQLPFENKPNESINENDSSVFTADTQFPTENNTSVKKSDSFFSADTEPPIDDGKELNVSIDLKSNATKDRLDKSDDIIMFDELDTQPFEDFQSQAILPPEMENSEDNLEEHIPLSQNDTIDDDGHIRLKPATEESKSPKPVNRKTRLKSDSSTDCEDIDILPTQEIPPKSVDDELTDCEDEMMAIDLNNIEKSNMPASNDKVDFEDLATQVIPEDAGGGDVHNKSNQKVEEKDSCFEDMLTQVIPAANESAKDLAFEDLPTQVLEEDVVDKPDTNEFSEEMVTFKIPVRTPMKNKRKDISKAEDSTFLKPAPSSGTKDNISNAIDEKYYAETQELYQDLCSQKETVTKPNIINVNFSDNATGEKGGEIVLGAAKEDKIGKKLSDTELSPTKKFIADRSPGSSDTDEKVNKFVANLSAKEIGDVIGVAVAIPRRSVSDPDVDVTPKKLRPFKFMETELPDSQEIKTSVHQSSKIVVTESSSESEQEAESNDSQENTPIVFKKKKTGAKVSVRKDLTTTFNLEALPTRVITRKRKPTVKMQENEKIKKPAKNIFVPKYLTEKDDDVDSDIIHENITRLKTENEKKNNKQSAAESSKVEKTNKIKTDNVKRQTKSKTPEVDSDLTVEKSESRRQLRAKHKDDTIDLTKDEDKSVKKAVTKSIDKSKTRDRRKQDKDNVDDIIDITKVEETSKIKEEPKPKARETRKTDRSKKKEGQEKITNYTINVDNDTNNSSSTSKVDHSLNSTTGSSRSTRSTRSRNKEKDSEKEVKKSVSPEPDGKKRRRGRPPKDEKKPEKEIDAKVKHVDAKVENIDSKIKKIDAKVKKDTKEDSQVEPGETRRSRRQRTVATTRKRSHEQSTVYEITDSPSLKRSSTGDEPLPSPKRTRSAVTRESCPADSASKTTYHVLFTAFPYEHLKSDLEKLGAAVVSDVSSCSVVVTLQLRRTFKLLCAVGLGRPVVGAAWINEGLQAGRLPDPWQYLLQDSASEARFGFSLERTLRGPRGYLRGRSVGATTKVMPAAQEMKMIVECSGGRWVDAATYRVGAQPRGAPPSWLCVSCVADRALWPALATRGAAVVSTEFILSGVLTQTLDVDKHLLF